jgi:transaldolase
MKIFIDTANIEEIKKAHSWGIIDGVTTNPTLVAKEGRNFIEVVKEITSIVDGPISAEAVSLKAEEIIEEGRKLSKLHKNINIKIPVMAEGLKATKVLSKEGIKVNMTLVFSTNQALLAAKAGASFVSPFIGRFDDISQDGMALIREIVQVFNNYHIKTELIAASVRHPLHVLEAAKAGAHIATIPFKVIEQMIKHPLTDIGIERFLSDWDKVKNK